MTSPDAPILLEQAIAGKLSELGNRVRIFSDAFRKTGEAQQRINVLCGHSGSEYVWATEFPAPTGHEMASFEIRVESADIRNHQAAFGYLAQAMAILRGYQPYTSIRPIMPFRYAPAGYDERLGTWTYTGIVRAMIQRPGSYELIEEIPPIEGVTVGIWRGNLLANPPTAVLQKELELEV